MSSTETPVETPETTEAEAKEPIVTDEEKLSYLFPKTYRCIVCDKDFMDFELRKTKLRVISIDTDYMTRYHVINPNHYEVLFCSHCGYASLRNYFDKLTQRQQNMIKEKITPSYKPTEFPVPISMEHVLQKYKQTLLCASAVDAKPSQKAFINLKLAWVLREAGHRETELKFLREAYEGLKAAFTTERFPIGNMDEPTAKYVIADLARRLGEMAEAMRWIGDVVVAKGLPGSLKERASDLKDLIREGKTT
jgi:uncharacterized protein (DUF2225 family)